MTNPLLDRAVDHVVTSGRASVSRLQRILGVGRADAERLLAQLEWLGIVSRGSRRVLLTPDDWREVLAG